MNPIVRAFYRTAREEARRAFQASNVGQIVHKIEKLGRSERGDSAEIKRLAHEIAEKFHHPSIRQEIGKTETGRMLHEVAHYAKRASKESLLDTALDALGPLGDVFKSLLRPSRKPLAGIEAEIEAARNLLRVFRPNLLARQARGPKPPITRVPGSVTGRKDVQQAQKLLESLGFTVIPPKSGPARIPRPPKSAPESSGVPPRRSTGPGPIPSRQRPQFPPDSPIVTGEMVRVESSNVHSIGFLLDEQSPRESTLKVRFWQQSRSGSGRVPGPMYYYYRVLPEVFQHFLVASSKGKFVWDNLRVRGTVSGHQYKYELKGISQGYVPRKATAYGHFGGTMREYFIRRQVNVRSPNGRNLGTYESELPDQLVAVRQNTGSRSSYFRPMNPRGRR